MTDAVPGRTALAAYLVSCGLARGRSPMRDPAYKEAVDLWESSPAFRAEVDAVAGGFGLSVAGVNRFGTSLASAPGTPFFPSASEVHAIYANGSAARDRPATAQEARAVLCAAISVTLAMAYPDERAMDGGDAPAPRLYAREVREKLSAMALEASRASAGDGDAEAPGDGGMGRVCDAVLRCPAVRTTPKGRQAEGTLAWHVMKAFEILEGAGHVDLRSPSANEDDEGGIHVIPKDRLRKLVRHHSASAVHALVRDALSRLPDAA